jgi:hypothetical protein
MHAVAPLGDPSQLAAARDRDEGGAALRGLGRHGDGFLGVTGVRDRERERPALDPRGNAVLLEYGDRHRQLVVERGRDDISRDSRPTHPQDGDVADVGRGR